MPDRSHSISREYAWPIISGLAILAVALVPWLWLAEVNRRTAPEIPWAALSTVGYMTLFLLWLQGYGPPASSAIERSRRLRLWPPRPADESDPSTAWTLVALLLALSVVWVFMGRQASPPDLSAFPTTSYRWSMFLMGGIMSGVVEEVAFRGYMQTGLERYHPRNAIVVTSLVFVASHITHGWYAVVVLGPGFFLVSVLYGLLARKTGTILPGMIIHTLGDLAYTYFGVLRGDGGVLFAG